MPSPTQTASYIQLIGIFSYYYSHVSWIKLSFHNYSPLASCQRTCIMPLLLYYTNGSVKVENGSQNALANTSRMSLFTDNHVTSPCQRTCIMPLVLYYTNGSVKVENGSQYALAHTSRMSLFTDNHITSHHRQ